MKASSAVAKSYAKAVFSLASERNQTEAIGRELTMLAALLAENPALRDVFSRPWITAVRKRAVAAEVAGAAGVSPLARDFLSLVVAQGRAEQLPGIVAAYRDLDDAAHGQVRAQVRSAIALTDDERRTLAARLARELGKQVILEEAVDGTLLGGFVAEIGSLVVDGSLDGQLARLRQRLVSA